MTLASLIRKTLVSPIRKSGAVLIAMLAAAGVLPVLGQVTTYHYDNARTGATLSETILTTANVNVSSFGKLFTMAVDGQIYAQPLYVPNVTIPQNGVHNVVYVATEHNSVYAFDANAAGSPLWHVNFGPPMPNTTCCMPVELLPEIGITSTPVIDLTSGTLYVVAESYESNVAYFRLHALDITTGTDKIAPAVIQGTVPGTSFDSNNGVLAFKPIQHWQRPGLLLLNGNIYIAFGGHQDNTPYHGWLFAYSAATLQQTAIMCFSPDGEGGGVWAGGVGLAADSSGNLYLETGNGPFDINNGGRDYGDSLLKIGTSSGLTVLDYFTPLTQLSDQLQDWDLGSSGPLLIPGTSLGVAGGKDGKAYIFNVGNLGHFNSTGDQNYQEWQATFSYMQGLPGGFWGGNYIYYNSTLYGFGERDTLKAFAFNGSLFNTTPTSQSTFNVPSGVSNDPGMLISADGTVPGTGIVWAAHSADGQADGKAHPGIFHAFDASDVSKEIWNSSQNSARDNPGNWAKWVPPIVVAGKVYLASYDGVVNVYGLLSATAGITATGGTPQSATVNSAFSSGLQATVKDAGNNPMSGVTVTFTAPSSGASAAFSGSATVTATTNASGVATSPAPTANGQTGAYTVTSTAMGVSTPANFHLTNLSGTPASISATAGTMQSAVINTAFNAPLQAVVKDAASNPLSGVTVTFTAPGSGASAVFAGSATATATTNATGVAIASVPTANAQVGSYVVTATTVGIVTPANFSLTNLPGSGGGSGGKLTGLGNSASTSANLTTEGAADWTHWGLIFGGPGVVDHKHGVTTQISNYTTISSLPIGAINNDSRPLTWTDGTNNTNGSDSSALYVDSNSGHAANGYSFTVPADTNVRTLIVHAGGQDGGGTLTASLSDSSAPNYQDTTPMQSGRYDRNYTLTYQANSAGQTLTVKWVNAAASGNVTLAGAALSMAGAQPGSITATAGTPQTATVNTAFAAGLQAIVKDSNDYPLPGVTVTFTAPGNGASTAFSGSNTATATTDTNGNALAPAPTANGQTGSYIVMATATGITTPANFNLTNLASSGGGGGSGKLIGLANSASTTANLTTEGVNDWVHWGDSSLTRKTGVSPQISNYTLVGAGQPLSYSNDLRALSWTDGTPTPTGSNNNGLYFNSTGNGFSFTATADTTTRVLTVHVGGWLSGATLKAHLSDSSAADFLDVTTPTSGQYDRNYTLTYNAASAGQTLTVSWVGSSGGGNVTINGAALAQAGPGITATAGTPQSATVNTAFATGLQATVKDAGNNPMSGVTVTFTAPGTGASAAFSGSNTATATTDTSGNATSQPPTANGQTGAYIVTATTPGVGTPANFSLTNLAATPASITATGGTPQSAMVSTGFATGLQATVKDSSNNPLPGVTVTFTAPGTGAGAAFGGSATTTATTNASGVATSPAPTANGQTGSYVVTATAAGLGTPANFNLTNLASSGGGGGSGKLTGLANSASTTANLTTEGVNDWVHWGDSSLTRKTGVSPQISNYTLVGAGQPLSYSNDLRALSWTDGTPTPTGSNNNGLYFNSTGNGFSFTATADTTTRVLTVHVGGWLSGATLKAHLSDSSAADFLDVTTPTSGQYDRNYTLTYNAASAGQTLTVSWVGSSGGGNVTINGAALAQAGPGITATAGTPQSATVNTAFATGLQATVKDAGNNPMSGVTVTFTAPGTGASAAFSGSNTATATTDTSGNATSQPPTANGQTGAYIVTATAPGVGTPANFNLTNVASAPPNPGPPAGITATAGTPQSTTVNTAFTTGLQATVKDSNNNLLSGVTVTFTAPGIGAGAAFSGSATATAITNGNGVATAPALTANGQTGSYTVTGSVAGVTTPAAFILTNNVVSNTAIKLVQHTNANSMINVQSESVAFRSPNTAGNWIGVAIFGGQSSSHTFTVTDSNGNTYRKALTTGDTIESVTLGIYYAENIKAGANQVKVVPNTSGYLRIVILEYSGVAAANSLDVTAAAQGDSVSPNSGVATTTANGDLLLGASTTSDENTVTAGPGYTIEELIPTPPGTRLTAEDQIQTLAGPTSASLTLGAIKDWTMGLAAFKKAP